VDRVVAVDLDSGRITWMSVRTDVSFEPAAQAKELHPLDWRTPPGPPRRRPDGESGFKMRLDPGRLEVCAGRGRPTNAFDPRTGRSLD
jgi:hypothetical protein